MEDRNFIIKGDIAFSKSIDEMECIKGGYLVCEEGVCKGVFEVLPEQYKGYRLLDHGNSIVIPGMTDLHVHAPQYTFRGLGMDMELLEWLQTNTFPEEARYKDIEYAKKAYSYFVEDLKNSYTTRACIFGTLHTEATIELMDQLEESGLCTYVGKVNMDRNGSEELCEASAEISLKSTLEWLNKIEGRYENTMPILTPRFTPSCSDELMRLLSVVAKDKKLRVQSHLSENLSEIEWVKELVPKSSCYADAYAIFDMLGSDSVPAIMAHCVYSDEKEQEILKKHGVYIAHCPESNVNVASGIAPVRKYLEKDLKVGIGTDVAAGSSINMMHAMELAVQVSKLYWRLVDQSVAPLKFEEVFYLATLGGGSYFGNVGSFMDGYEFDAVVIDDSRVRSMRQLELRERLERLLYQNANCDITKKFVKGKELF